MVRRPIEVDPTREYAEIGIRSFGRGVFHKEKLSGSALGSKRVYEIHPGDLLLNIVFAWEGAVAVAGEAERGRCGSHRFLTYVVDREASDPRYLAYYFRSPAGLEFLEHISPGSAGRNRTLNAGAFEDGLIPLPDVLEQRRVADRLDALVARWARTDWVTEHRVRATALLPNLVDHIMSKVATTPTTLGDVLSLVNDIVHPGDDVAPAECFVGLQHVESHTGRCIGSAPLGGEQGRKFRFRPGDIVFGYLRPYLNKVWVADRWGLCSVDQYVLRPAEGQSPHILAYLLRSRRILDRAIELTHSLQLPRLRSGLLLGLDVPMPSEAKIADVEHALDAMSRSIHRLDSLQRSQKALLAAGETALLNEAFTGSL